MRRTFVRITGIAKPSGSMSSTPLARPEVRDAARAPPPDDPLGIEKFNLDQSARASQTHSRFT